jgi:hypothetical protein
MNAVENHTVPYNAGYIIEFKSGPSLHLDWNIYETFSSVI